METWKKGVLLFLLASVGIGLLGKVWALPLLRAEPEFGEVADDIEETDEEDLDSQLAEMDQEDVKSGLSSGLSCDQCGGNMPLNIPGGGIAETHEWRFKVLNHYMYMPGLQKGTDSWSTREGLQSYMMVPTQMHMTMTGFAAAYSFSEDFLLMGMFMFMWKKMNMVNRAGQTSTMEASGVGDLMLMGKYRIYRDGLRSPRRHVSFLFGLSCPTGSVRKKDNGQILPYAMQMGTGTFDPIVGLLYSDAREPFWWGVNLIYTERFYNNPHGYHWGDHFRYDAYVMYQVAPRILLELQLNGSYEGRISGEMEEIKNGVGHVMNNPALPYMSPMYDARNYGYHSLWMTVGVQWQPVELHILNIQFSYALYQDLKGVSMRREFAIFFVWHMELPTAKSRRADKSPFPF